MGINLRGTHFGELPDEELDRVERFFRDLTNFELRAGLAIRRAFDEVIDGPRTGRWDVDQLEKTEKTYIGTKVEILLRAEFDLPRGELLDCRVSGVEVDIKFTIGANWTIPAEAIEQVCLLVRASDKQSHFSVGLLRTTLASLNLGRNRDGKSTINASGRQAVRWLVQNGSLPENLLFQLDPAIRDQIFSFARSGQRRVDELFRLVQDRIIPRQTIETVAQQQDPMRRGRAARTRLLQEGIVVICGTYERQQREAQLLDLPELAKDEWISTTAPGGWQPLDP